MIIPCHRGGHHCRWPACPLDCDGRDIDSLVQEGAELYDGYLEGEDNLQKIHEIATELRRRK